MWEGPEASEAIAQWVKLIMAIRFQSSCRFVSRVVSDVSLTLWRT